MLLEIKKYFYLTKCVFSLCCLSPDFIVLFGGSLKQVLTLGLYLMCSTIFTQEHNNETLQISFYVSYLYKCHKTNLIIESPASNLLWVKFDLIRTKRHKTQAGLSSEKWEMSPSKFCLNLFAHISLSGYRKTQTPVCSINCLSDLGGKCIFNNVRTDREHPTSFFLSYCIII